MASSPQPATPVQAPGTCPHPPHEARPRCMTRCECSGVSFEQVARQIHLEGRTFQEATRRTGCGQTCGACIPDLKAYLASFSS